MRRILIALILAGAAIACAAPADAAGAEAGNRFRSACPYPIEALKRHVTGNTLITYRGREDGAVTDVKVLATSGNAALDTAAVMCVSRWRLDPFKPIDAFFRGTHRTYITWTISQSGQAAGYFAGVPHNCAARYPKDAYPAQGTTRLSFVIEVSGQLTDVRVTKSSGNAKLDAAALECVQTWHYIPAVKGGEIVRLPWAAEVVWNSSWLD